MAGAGDEGPAEDKEWFPMPPYLCYVSELGPAIGRDNQLCTRRAQQRRISRTQRCQSELPRKEHDAHLARCIGPSDDVPSDQRVVLKLQAQVGADQFPPNLPVSTYCCLGVDLERNSFTAFLEGAGFPGRVSAHAPGDPVCDHGRSGRGAAQDVVRAVLPWTR